MGQTCSATREHSNLDSKPSSTFEDDLYYISSEFNYTYKDKISLFLPYSSWFVERNYEINIIFIILFLVYCLESNHLSE